MRPARSLFLIGSLVVSFALLGFVNRQDPAELDGPGLKAMITNMGYEAKDLNAEIGG